MTKSSKYLLGLFVSLTLFLYMWVGLTIGTVAIAFLYFWLGFHIGEQKERSE